MTTPRTSTEAITVSSKLLLEGWRMLAESCPICFTPLLQSRKGELYCAKCDARCVRQNDLPEENEKQFDSVNGDEELEEQEDNDVDYKSEDMKLDQSSSDKNLAEWRQKREKASSLIGAKMLLGWKLLNEHCANDQCSMPLLQDRNGQKKCVLCDNTNTLTPSVHVNESSANKIQTEQEQPKQQQQQEQKQKQEPQLTERKIRPIVFSEPSQDEKLKEQRLTSKMLSGWTMLAEHCQNKNCLSPLLKSRTGQKYCSSCDEYFNAMTTNEKKSDFVPSASPLEEKKSKTATSSALLSQKLLLGWTLLAEECTNPNCTMPLMKNKENQIVCVCCGASYNDLKQTTTNQEKKRSREDSDESETTNDPLSIIKRAFLASSSEQETSKPNQLKVEEKRNNNNNDDDDDDDDDQFDNEFFESYKQKRISEMEQKKENPMKRQNKNKIQRQSQIPNSRINTINSTVDVLFEKITYSRDILSNSNSIDEQIKIAELITKLGSAVEVMQRLNQFSK